MLCSLTATGYDWTQQTECKYGDKCYTDGDAAYCHCEFNAFNKKDYKHGDKLCFQDKIYTCKPDGIWDSETCNFGCVDNSASGHCNQCAPGSKRCVNAVASSCVATPTGYQWDAGTTCPYGCNNGICNHCSANEHCSNGQVCINYQCQACQNNDQCDSKHVCIQGACRPVPELFDGAYRWPDGSSAKNCATYHNPPEQYAPATADGIYWIQPNSTQPPFKAVCDMTTDGGGWTLIAKYISNLQLFSFHEAKHQQQNSSQGADLSTPPNLGDTNTYGHINFTWFEINGRSLKLQCRTSTTGTWFSHTRNDIFQNWTPGDKNTYGNAQGWGVIGRYGQHSRSNHFICG
jgi:hypothetical protein